MKRFTLQSSLALALVFVATAATLPASASYQGGRNTVFNNHPSSRTVYGLTGEAPGRAPSDSAYRYNRQLQGAR